MGILHGITVGLFLLLGGLIFGYVYFVKLGK